MADDLRNVILKIRDERRRYGDAKAQLHAMLPPAHGPHDIANYLPREPLNSAVFWRR